MNLLMAQLVVIAQGPDGEENVWMQLLVFILLAIFWAVGGIMKARSAKSQEQEMEGGRQPKPRPAHKPASGKKQQQYHPSFKRVSQTRPTAEPRYGGVRRQYPKGSLQSVGSAVINPYAHVQKETPQKPPPKPVDEHGREALAKAKKGLAEAQKATELAIVERPIVEIDTSEQLRSAMLHFEIFGKCIALRESQEHTWTR